MDTASLFFAAGTLLGLLGMAARVSIWFYGQDLRPLLRSLPGALWKKRGNILKGLFFGTLLKRKLRRSDPVSGIFKSLFLLSYLSLLVVYHIKVDSIPSLQGVPFLLKIFYAPFSDLYFFSDISTRAFSPSKGLYGVINDTFETIMLLFAIYLLVRLFLRKRVQFKLTFDDLFSHFIITAWFFVRLLSEATTLLAFQVPPEVAGYWYVGSFFSSTLGPLGLPWQGVCHLLWPLSGLLLGVYIASIPWTKLWHIFVGPLQIIRRYLCDERLSAGRALSKPFDLMELMEAEDFKVSVGTEGVEDLDWAQRMSLDACMKCGRCQEVCPAYAAGRDLSPTRMIQDLRGAMRDHFRAKVLGRPGVSLIGERIHEETVWACTTCGSCIQACPVEIVQPQFLVDFRRALLSSHRVENRKANVLGNFADKSNPYGLPKADRDGWTKGLDIPRLQKESDVEYLYWVGCASSYDSRNQKVAKSFVRILREANIRFGILGREEPCCGETVRRMGDEARFQEMALANIELLKSYRVKKILIHCPHGYNTFKNEYPQFGGEFEVIHHSEFILDLIEKGKIRATKRVNEEVAFHDPCYLGRYNGKFEAPRRVLEAIPGLKLRELSRRRERSFCCGGGGGNSWYEVPGRETLSSLRIGELERADADWLAVACPFCISMLEDALRVKGLEKKFLIRDIAELIGQALD